MFSNRPVEVPTVRFGDSQLVLEATPKCLGVTWDRTLSFGPHISNVYASAMRALNAVRRLQGMHWGTSIASTLFLYTAAVRSILEYAVVVWDSAKPQMKAKLDGIQRYALIAATGVLHTTSTAALEFLCCLDPLQTRRNVILICYVSRCRRLAPCLLRLTFDRWTDGTDGSQSVQRKSPFSIGVSLERYYGVEHTDATYDSLPDTADWSSQITVPTPSSWRAYGNSSSRTAADQARARDDHARLVASFGCESILAYTDGSCSGPAGPTGSGAFIRAQGLPDVRTTDSVGIGTNNTAELYAILLAVRHSLSIAHQMARAVTLHICSDSQYSLGVLFFGHTAKADHTLVSTVQALLAQWRSIGHTVEFHWTPGHCWYRGQRDSGQVSK